jgi:L-lactate dehydrogenase (cytochrome)
LAEIYAVILKYAGRDATDAFLGIHAPTIIRENLSSGHFKGRLDTSTITPGWTQITQKAQPTGQPRQPKPPLASLINRYVLLLG